MLSEAGITQHVWSSNSIPREKAACLMISWVFGNILVFWNVAAHIVKEIEVKRREPIPEPMPPGIIGKYAFVIILFSRFSHIEYDPRLKHIHF
jgi:hypothetical protein